MTQKGYTRSMGGDILLPVHLRSPGVSDLPLSAKAPLEHIYDAAMSPEGWQNALDALVGSIGGRASALLLSDYSHHNYKLNAASSIYADIVNSPHGDRYLTEMAPLEAAQWQAIARLDVGDIRDDHDLGVARDILDARPDYVFLKDHADVKRRLAFRLNANKGWFDAMTIGFSAELAEVPASARAALAPYLPHLAKAVELGRTFHTLQSQYKAILGALNQVNIGIVIALPNAEIALANREAQRILDDRDAVFTSRDNQIICRSSKDTEALHTAIAAMAVTASGQTGQAQRHLTVPRRPGTHALLAEVTPLRDTHDEFNTQFHGAMIVLIDPDRSETLDIRKFAALHGLTEAEAEVTSLILKGHSAREIADIRCTAYETARNQIKAVNAKTGCNKRGDLVRLVVRTLPPIL